MSAAILRQPVPEIDSNSCAAFTTCTQRKLTSEELLNGSGGSLVLRPASLSFEPTETLCVASADRPWAPLRSMRHFTVQSEMSASRRLQPSGSRDLKLGSPPQG